MKVGHLCLTLCDPTDLYSPRNSPGQILEWVAFPFSRGSSQTQGWNPGLTHWGQILYQLSHQGSPRILEWVAYPSSGGPSRPSNQTEVSCIAARFLPAKLPCLSNLLTKATSTVIWGEPTRVRNPAECLANSFSPNSLQQFYIIGLALLPASFPSMGCCTLLIPFQEQGSPYTCSSRFFHGRPALSSSVKVLTSAGHGADWEGK